MFLTDVAMLHNNPPFGKGLSTSHLGSSTNSVTLEIAVAATAFDKLASA